MDSDPWADAPPSPKPGSEYSSPPKPTGPSPLITEQIEQTAPVSQTEPSSSSSPSAADPSLDDGIDDFDDFDAPAAGPRASSPVGGDDGDDGFGDFGDFEEADEDGDDVVPGLADRDRSGQMAEVVDRRQALNLRPLPSRPELLNQISTLLSPLYASSSTMSDDPPRLVGGLAQIMVSESSRDAYTQLATPPILKPLDWTRSRVRREHLISMGVPVNLDEVDSHRISALPPLRITTAHMPPPRRAESVDVNGRYTAEEKGKGRDVSPANQNGNRSLPASAGGVNGVEKPVAQGRYGIGDRPEFDMAVAEDLCGIEEDQLSLLPLERLKRIQNDFVDVTSHASVVLAWLLQLKDAQTQDSVTYNGMISELIANAAKVKAAQSANSGGVFRKASTRQRPQSNSGTVTPRRVASPAMR